MCLRRTLQGLLLLDLLKRHAWYHCYAKSISIGDCSVLVVECLVIREALIEAIKKNFNELYWKWSLSGSEFYSWQDFCFTRYCIEDIRNTCPIFKEVTIGHCARACNREVNRVAKECS